MVELHKAAVMQRRFTIGACLSLSLATFRHNLFLFLILGLASILPSVFYSILDASDFSIGPPGKYWSIGAGDVVDMLGDALIAAPAVYGTFQSLRGNPVGLGNIFFESMFSIGRVLPASLLGSLAINFAEKLLIVPGIIVAIVIWVSIPAIVVERAGIIASFHRSAGLTRGQTWKILGLMSILFGVLAGVLMVIIFIAPEDLRPGFLVRLHVAASLQTILEYAVAAIYSVLSVIASTVGYYLLRAEKEGVYIDDVAGVFD